MAPLVRLDELQVGYRGRALLPPISLSIDRGEQWALIGQNGSGKTTLLRSMLGILPSIAGSVVWGEDVNVGYVPQRASLDQNVPGRVVDLVRGGVDQKWSFANLLYVRSHESEVQRAMQDTNTMELAREQYSELSEGQKQRVLVARALASNPELLVLDEPTSAMDVNAERGLFDLLDELRQKRDLAVIIVSHQLSVTGRYATHALLVDKDRRFALCGTMEEVAEHPETTARYGVLLKQAYEEAR
jgi:zinc transport system ATP-binding protein